MLSEVKVPDEVACPFCQKPVDPDHCYCGQPIDHDPTHHTPVPAGCECPLFHVNHRDAFVFGSEGEYLDRMAREYYRRLDLFVGPRGIPGMILFNTYAHALLRELKKRAIVERQIEPGKLIKIIQSFR